MYPLSLWPSFLEQFMESYRVKDVSSYSVLRFALLHNLHPKNSVLVKKYTVNYLLSDGLTTERERKERNAFSIV